MMYSFGQSPMTPQQQSGAGGGMMQPGGMTMPLQPGPPQPMGPPQQLGQPSGQMMAPAGGPPPGVPPGLAAIWHQLPPQLQGLLGHVGQFNSQGGGLLGAAGAGGASPFTGLLGMMHPPAPVQQPQPMRAVGNPYPVPQMY